MTNDQVNGVNVNNSDTSKSKYMSVSYLPYAGCLNELKGLTSLYKDPGNKGTVIRHAKVKGIGPVNMTVVPLNKFKEVGKNSVIKASELGMQFSVFAQVDAEGNVIKDAEGNPVRIVLDNALLIEGVI